jgi:hypothetical protein
VNFENEEKNKNLIIDEILKDNIYNWMKNIKFNYHSKQFKTKRNNISFEIKQKSNNYPAKDKTFDLSALNDIDNCNFASISNDSFSYSDSYKNNSDFASGLKSVLIEMDNYGFVTVQKYEQTSNVCSVMRCLSMIEPLSSYLMDPIKAKKIFNKYQSTSFLNIIRKYFLELWSETKLFAPIIFIKILEKKDNFKIKEEQDPILFLNLFIEYVNKKLNKFDYAIKFNFNNIEQQLQEKPYINELKKIIDNSNSIIGQLFYGLMQETYKCNNCNKELEKIKRFETIDIEYREIIDDLYEAGDSLAFIDMNNFLDYIFLENRLDNKKEKMEECPSCKKKIEITKRKIIAYPSYLIIRLKIGDYEEKKGFVNMNQKVSNLSIKFKEIKNMEVYISDSLKKNKTNNKYELLSMICYLKDLKDNNKIKFISICKNIIDNDEAWIYFMCNNENHKIYKNYEELIKSISNNDTLPYILFYELKK